MKFQEGVKTYQFSVAKQIGTEGLGHTEVFATLHPRHAHVPTELGVSGCSGVPNAEVKGTGLQRCPHKRMGRAR